MRLLPLTAAVLLLALPDAARAGERRSPRTPLAPGAEPAPAAEPGPSPEGPYTWYRDVLPIVQSRCQLCHSTGGVGPFTLLAYEDAKANHKDMASAVKTGYMPPWMPADGCQSFRDARRLTRAEINVITAWSADGAPAGTPGDAPPPLPPDSGVVTLAPGSVMLNAGADYLPSVAGGADQWRCFTLDPRLARDRDVVGVEIHPGAEREVQHAVLYTASAEEVLAADRADPELGWSCPGTPAVPSPEIVGVWGTGQSVIRYPPGTGIPLKARSLLVLQVHYNLPSGAPLPDRTQVRLQYAPQRVERPATILLASKSNFAVPPKSAGFTLSVTYPMSADYTTLLGVYPHMHQLGRRVRVERNGSCVIDIPFWDAGGQQFYFLENLVGIPVTTGDALKINCIWNNPGPKKVAWGEGLGSEMCAAYLYLTH